VERSRRRIVAARVIAILADAVQLGIMPIFAGGAPTGFDAALDVVVGAVVVALLGWHWAFLPAFALELLPAVDLAPTWTIAVLLATRGTARAAEPASATPEPSRPPTSLPPSTP